MLETILMCLAVNVYFEARSDSMEGQYAVAHVVMNRVQSNRFPNDVCSVVTQQRKGRTCQFSWYCDGKSDQPNMKSKQWGNAIRYASIVMSETINIDVTDGATHYHATYVRPAWRKTKTRTTRIDRHIFYRWEK